MKQGGNFPKAWQDSWASRIGDHSRFGEPAPCSGFHQQGLGAWSCVYGGAWLDSFRDGLFSRENAGPGGWKAEDNGKRETKVMKHVVWAGRGK